MALDLKREAPLYDSFHTFQVVDETNHPSETNLVFRILPGSQPSTVPGQHEPLYYFEVTDENNSYFLYYFVITEQRFAVYKREQEILVDYHVFPLKIIELLDLCSDKSKRGSNESSYMSKLNLTTGILSIYESNKFKQIKHIELPMREGDDAAIKQYLSSRLSLTLNVKGELEDAISKLKEKLENLTRVLDETKKTSFEQQSVFVSVFPRLLSNILIRRTHQDAEIRTREANHRQEMNEMKSAHSNECDNLKRSHAQEIQEKSSLIDQLKETFSIQKSQLENENTGK
jgi:spindle assembly abnormal protein 6